jgi:UTP--glucose-1-phosphate uridylyltransferase
MPKEMLPVIDKPAIQYVVEEAVNSGLGHILLITGRNKQALENHFDRNVELETLLTARGDTGKLVQISPISDDIDLHYVRQGNPLGLGHAVLKAETFVAGEPFALLLGDDIIEHGDELLADMIALAQHTTATIIALMEVPQAHVSRYGVAAVTETTDSHIFTIDGFVEKPHPDDAPSRLVAIGRYVLQPGVFDVLRKARIWRRNSAFRCSRHHGPHAHDCRPRHRPCAPAPTFRHRRQAFLSQGHRSAGRG